jgi:hypothetical protein
LAFIAKFVCGRHNVSLYDFFSESDIVSPYIETKYHNGTGRDMSRAGWGRKVALGGEIGYPVAQIVSVAENQKRKLRIEKTGVLAQKLDSRLRGNDKKRETGFPPPAFAGAGTAWE